MTLSRREIEVLRHVAEGKTREVIAADLGISRRTASNHLTRIFRKLDADCAIGALRAVGWLRIPALVLVLILVAACSATPSPSAAVPTATPNATPTAAEPTPVAAGQFAGDVYDVYFDEGDQVLHDVFNVWTVLTVTCSQRPTSFETLKSYCDLDSGVIHTVDKATWDAAGPGDAWPPASGGPIGIKVQ